MSLMRNVAELLPQSGAMVLLDAIVAFDERRIDCRAVSHTDPANPLARDGVLSVWAGIEYAAQAMAAHFALSQPNGHAARIGLLGALRDVACSVTRLDDVRSPMTVAAERLTSGAEGSIYAFVLTAGDGCELMRGRATVVQKGSLRA